MSTARVFQPFQAYAKEFTARLRLRSHRQALDATVQQAARCRLSPAGAIAVQRVDELDALLQRHRRTFDPTLRARAMQLLNTLPLIAADEDPHLSVTRRALRDVAYLDAAHMPIAFSLLNHITRHTFMLDGFALCSLLTTLRRLRHPQTLEALEILLPRLREVATAAEVTATEAASMLAVLQLYGVDDEAVRRALCAIIAHTFADLATLEMRDCVAALGTVGREVAEPALQAIAPHLCARLAEGTRQYVVLRSVLAEAAAQDGKSAGLTVAERASAMQELRELRQLIGAMCDCAISLAWAPRRVLDELVAAALSWCEPGARSASSAHDQQGSDSGDALPQHMSLPRLSRLDLCVVVQMLRCTDYRHDRALLQLSTRIAGAPRPVSALLAVPDTAGHATSSRAASNVAALVQVAEALAHFRCPGAANVLPALLEELAQVFAPAASLQLSGAMSNKDARLLLSRLLRCVAALDVVAAAEADTLSLVEQLCTCPQLTSYVAGAAASEENKDDTVLCATLLGALAALSAQLELRYGAMQQQQQQPSAVHAERWHALARLMTRALAQHESSSNNNGSRLAGAEEMAQAVRVLCATPSVQTRASQYMPLHELQQQWLQ